MWLTNDVLNPSSLHSPSAPHHMMSVLGCRALMGMYITLTPNIYEIEMIRSVSSVAQSCPTLGDPIDCSMPGFPVHHQLPELAQTRVYRVSDAIQPSHLLPSIFPSSKAFFNESVLRIRWPKYWSFSFSISPSSE